MLLQQLLLTIWEALILNLVIRWHETFGCGACMRRNIWLTATHIPGIQNTTADKLSRKFQDRTERQLKPNVFNLLIERWEKPEIDFFASRRNYQFKPFVSWHADPDAYATDAMCLSWKTNMCISFPFQHVIQNSSKAAGRSGSSLSHSTTMENSSLVSKDLSDVNQSTSTSTQGGIFTTTTTQQEQNPPIMAQASTDGLSLVRTRLKTFQHELAISSWNRGGLGLPNSTECIWISGQTLQQQEMKVPFIQL